jgi:S1-C subfamily serine protease
MLGTRSRTLGHRVQAAALMAAIALGVVQPAAHAAPAQDDAQLQKQLDEARGRLDDAARDVAELSQKLYGEQVGPMLMGGPGGRSQGAMLGVNIGGGTDRAEGVEVIGVSPAGPAESAGLKQGDIITAVDGKPLRKTDDRNAGRQLVDHLQGVQPGQKVKVDYLRDGKKLSTVVTTVAAEPPMFRALREHMPMLEGMAMALPPEVHAMMVPGGRGFRSLELVPLTPKLGQYFGADSGLLVVKAPANAAGARLEEGDVILTIGGRTPENARHAFRILGSYQPQEKVRVEVLRQRKRVVLDVEMPEAGELNPPLPAGFRPHVPPAPPASPTAAPRPATRAALLPEAGI